MNFILFILLYKNTKIYKIWLFNFLHYKMDPLLILLFIILFMLSAFFSGTELALMSLAEHKIDSLYKSRKFWSKSLKKIKENNDRLLITILIGNNLVNTFTASFATSIAISIAKNSWASLNEATAIGIATWIVTFLLLLFWEIIPKSIATKNASAISLTVAPIYKVIMIALYPVISFMEILIKLFSWSKKDNIITDEEIESFIDMWKQSWWIDHHEHEKIKSILEFDEISVEEVMTPRVKIDAISSELTVKDAMDFYLSHTHTRLPVYTETIDRIDHFLTARDLIREYTSWNLWSKISEIKLKKVLKVPLNQSISKLFETFQASNKIMAIIIDEYGGVSWLVTLEDIIEQVFWEIRDESDKETDEFVEIWEDSLRVESDVLIEDLLYKYDLSLEDIWLDSKEFDGETLSFVITHILEWFPSSWQELKFDIIVDEENEYFWSELLFKIVDIENAKIWHVDVKIIKKELLD